MNHIPERETSSPQEITRHTFIEAFTHRDASAGPIPTDELLQRLDITLTQLREDIASNEKRLHISAANCLRGALIRLAQAYGDASVEAKVRQLVALTADITGI